MTKAIYALVFILASIGLARAESDIELVKTIFKAPRRDWSKMPWIEHAEDLKPMGERAWPALTTLLTDYEHGLDASETMLVLDPNRAGPIIFRAMPVKNANVHGRTFKFFLRQIERGEKHSFTMDMHDAAVRCLKAKETGSADAMLILAYTGDKEDMPLIRSFVKEEPNAPRFNGRHISAESALGKLGDEQVLRSLTDRLSKPVPAKITDELAISLHSSMQSAGFSRNKRFVPLLCKHLDDPTPGRHSDYIAAVPSWSAEIALDQIVNGTPSGMKTSKVKWKEWCATNVHN